MECARCHAVIADKAIVCYRCGTPTAIPAAPERSRPQERPTPAGSGWTVIIMLLVLASVGGWLGAEAEAGAFRTVCLSLAGLSTVGAGAAVLRRRK